MMPPVVLLDTAEADLADAKNWCRNCDWRLEADFLLCIEEAFDRIARHPNAFAALEGDFRSAIVHRFPFRVIYRLDGGQIIVVAILHTSRHPRTWLARGH
jgi:plasmid stabilization system protein ParE